ncbi:acyl-CoA dehydrogenase family protein [Pontixanthobacter aquaemixtae]|uniref:Pilus assembly protein CpaB n=1 Tax=Pontixanthobacter aquaemixtae TaxID=1958940 RepID=A0A844ZYQ0_9SPHN|nr:acyl-CoA dehydrogenase family protein [Pontixanthobacter aquaemixtae]MXO91867.1 pilus assembly protein CpaB [Pontixanthobacter aquaemixtae]
MDFTFTDEQQMLRDSLSGFLAKNYDFDQRNAIVRSEAGWSRDVWGQFAELGVLGMPFSEEHGGFGGGASEMVAIAEPFGAHLLAEPFIASVALGGAALAAGNSDWLEKVMGGEAIAAFAYEEGRGTPDPEAVAMQSGGSGDAITLSGEKRMVLGGADADVLVVAARHGDTLALFTVDPAAEGVAITSYPTIDGRRAANIRFDAAPASLLLGNASDAIRTLLDNAILAISAESIGAMGALLRQTAEYAATRKQFGVPIMTFQTIAHRLADMKIAYSKARATMLYTAALIEAGQAGPKDIAILKGQTGKLGREIGEAAIQTHGGVGMTDELSISHLHKRILANDALLGGFEYHLRKVGTLA